MCLLRPNIIERYHMSNKVKELRGQVRIAVKESLPEVLAIELIGAITKKLTDAQNVHHDGMMTRLNARLDAIETDCKAALQKQDARAKAVQGFLVQSAQKDLNDRLYNAEITMTAWEEVMMEKLGNKEELDALVDAKKKEVNARYVAKAEAEMQKRTKESAESPVAVEGI